MTEKKPETLKEALDEHLQLLRDATRMAKYIDEKFGVTLGTSFIVPNEVPMTILVDRGIEEIDNAYRVKNGATLLYKPGESLRMVHEGFEFAQYADKKTGVFVKAGKKPPKVVLVEDGED